VRAGFFLLKGKENFFAGQRAPKKAKKFDWFRRVL